VSVQEMMNGADSHFVSELFAPVHFAVIPFAEHGALLFSRVIKYKCCTNVTFDQHEP